VRSSEITAVKNASRENDRDDAGNDDVASRDQPVLGGYFGKHVGAENNQHGSGAAFDVLAEGLADPGAES
jgi:hypothetical protein